MNRAWSFDSGLINSIRINRSAIERRAQTLGTRRTFKVESQAAAYLRAISCMDLTTLTGADTTGKVERLCAKALRPVDPSILTQLGMADYPLTVGAVCVYHAMVETAAKAVRGRIPIAAVSTGFPAGQTPLELKFHEIEFSIKAGATEIDIVIHRTLVLEGKWRRLYDELKEIRMFIGERAKIKTILGTGDLETLENVAKASAVSIMAGADFIKTSTGYEPVNATLEAGIVMAREIRKSNWPVGFKPAGGIKTAKDAMLWLTLMREELGEEWTKPELFRIGASGLLIDLERQLSHLVTGRYAAAHHQAMG